MMEAEIINPFLEATIRVLKIMAFLEPVPGKPYIKKGNSTVGDISGVVGIVGEAEGSLSISFSKECILFITSKMLGEEQKEINDNVKDGVVELTNMLSGDSRRRLLEMAHTFQGSIPSVISGSGHEVRHIVESPILSISFNTPASNFVVEFCFK